MTPLPALYSNPARTIMTANIPLTIIIPSAAIGNYSHAAGNGGIGCTVGQNEVDPGGGGNGGGDGNVSPMAVGSNEDEDDHEAAAGQGSIGAASNGIALPAENGNLQGE